MEVCDVLIVGGGPAGSTCARVLREAGLDVLILDKSQFPRDKVCAGWITPEVVETLELDLDDYARGRTFQPIRRFLTGMLGGRAVVTDYGRAVSYGIRRFEFDHYLLQCSGARLRLGEPLRSMARAGGDWLINGEIRTPLVIGAGGHFCPVARTVGAKVAGERVVAAQEVEFELSEAERAACGVQGETPELFFCPDLRGYGWCFRKGNFLNVGLGREDSRSLAHHLQEFTRSLARSGRIPSSLPEKFNGHAYLLYGQVLPRRLHADGTLLIGDAAGLAYPQSGEGIRPAVESAIMAATAVLDAGGDYREDELAPFEAQVVERFGPRRNRRDDGWLPAGIKRAIAAKLLANRSFSRKVVLDRWFLHRDQKPLSLASLSP